MALSVSAEQIPGTPISILPPNGFQKTDQFPGYINKNTGSSILVNEIPGPYSKVIKGFNNKQALNKQKMKLISKEQVIVQNKNSLLLGLLQEANGISYKKWMLLIDMNGTTLTVMAIFPTSVAEQQDQLLKKTILKLEFASSVNPLDTLSFTIEPSKPYEIAKIMGNNLIITPHKVFPLKNLSEPFMIVGSSVSVKPEPYSNKEYAVLRATKIANIKFKELERLGEIKIDGLSGYVIEASGLRKEKVDVSIYQVILYDVDRYYLLQGIAPTNNKDSNFTKFIETAKSFRKK